MRCLWCHKDVAAGWALCPDCGSTLEAGPAGDALVPTYRPAAEKAFDPFVIASVRRMTATGPLVVLGNHERIEANLVPSDDGDAVVCHDINGPVLFRLARYTPVDGAVSAFTDDGEPISTYLPATASTVEVRDGATAPVATLEAKRGTTDHWDLLERGRQRRLASCWRQSYRLREWVHEQWSVMPTVEGRVPLTSLALVAIPVICHAWLGRAPYAIDDTNESLAPFGIDLVLMDLFSRWN